jgi:hypothetical protein
MARRSPIGARSGCVSRVAAAALAVLGLTPSSARAADKLACVAAVEQAQTLRSDGKLKAAREKLISCAQAGCPKVVREDCTTELREVEREMPSVVVRARDHEGNDLRDVRVDADGGRLADKLDGSTLTLDPGAVTIHVEAEGFAPKDMPLVVARGEKLRTLVVILERPQPAAPAPLAPAAPRAPRSPVPWILLGAGVASLGAFAVLEGIAQSEYATLKSGCGQMSKCSDDATAPTKSKFIAAGVTMGVGLASASAAATLWILPSTRQKAGASAGEGARAGLRRSPGFGAARGPIVEGFAFSPTGVALRGSF